MSRQAYYRFLHGSRKDREGRRLLAFIREVQDRTGYAVGYRHMTARIRKELGIRANGKRVRRLMAEHGLLSAVRRKRLTPEQYQRRRELKDGRPRDLLGRNFFSGTPRKVFVVDITYLYCLERMYYMDTMVDLFNREAVAWAIGTSPDRNLCMEAVRELSGQCDLRGCIIHTDAGSSYLSYDYMGLLRELGAVPSMSKGSCWDNAAMESFHGVLKSECLYNRFGKTKFKERRVRSAQVLRCVEDFVPYYNRERLKRSLGWLFPAAYLERNPKGTLPMVIRKPLTQPGNVLQ